MTPHYGYDYRPLLRDILRLKRGQNPRYSLRAYARDLGLAAPRLSLILRGKQGLSSALATKLVEKLKLPEPDGARFVLMVEASDSRSKLDRSRAIEALEKLGGSERRNLETLDEARFAIISEWQHFATLELFEVAGFPGTPEAAAQRLQVEVNLCRESFERLERVGLLKKVGEEYRASGKNLTTTEDIPSMAIRNFNRQMLLKAIESIEGQGIEERDLSTLTFAVSKHKLPALKQEIRNFRRNIVDILEDEGESHPTTDVYFLGCQLFNLTPDKESQ